MRSPAAAVAWEFRQRHRSGLLVPIAYLIVLAAIKIAIQGPVDLDDDSLAFAVIVPVTVTFIYFLAIFSFGLSGDVAARQSIYPARLFTLPVTTPALAAWPMLYGAGAMVLLWFATRFLALWPPGVKVPLVWPALLAASLLAWTQALMWTAYPLRGLRVIITVLWLATMDTIVMLALNFKPSEAVMLAILAPQVPLAYLAARLAVARARRGDVPDWQRFFTRLEQIVRLRRREPFLSAARAQAWFEWRQHGRSLPLLIGALLPFELALLFAFKETPELIFEMLLFVLFTPPFMAAFVAATVRKPHTAFTSTRPLTAVSLVAAKLKAAMWSTLAAWLLVLIATPLALRLSGAAPVVIERAHRLVDVVGTPRAIAIVLLALAALVVSTWKQLVQSLYIGMSGREWVVKASVFLALSLVGVFLPVAVWISHSRRAMAFLFTNLTSIAAVLVFLKLSAAVWVALRLHDKRLVSDRALIVGAICWDLAVFAVYGVFLWVAPDFLFRRDFLALVAILAAPLTRLSAAPLALAWNRHR